MLHNKYYLLVLTILTLLVTSLMYGCGKGGSESAQTSSTEETVQVTSSTPETSSKKINLKIEKKTTTKQETTTNDGKLHYTEAQYQRMIDYSAQFPYYIKVNRAKNWVIVYAMDKDGYYSIPYKIFWCSTGLYADYTPLGTFSISDKYDWRLMVDGTYAQYAVRIYDHIMLHSVPYYSASPDQLEVDEFNKLGSPASLGCVRFAVSDIKWIYDNCDVGTSVEIYEDSDEVSPLAMPVKYSASSEGIVAGWDPTDPDDNNPYHNIGEITTK